ncbi:MAG: hypothetical protein WKG32_12270 [Gemmatimonadaceae bacterium]
MSLWDMLAAYGNLFGLMLGMGHHVRFSLAMAATLSGGAAPIGQELSASVLDMVGAFARNYAQADLDSLPPLIERMQKALTPECRVDHAARMVDDLLERTHDQLAARHFLYVAPSLLPYHNAPLVDRWGDVPDKFPSAAFDMEEAGKCLALGRHTASVFHLMRVLEAGLRALGASLGDAKLDADANPTWERILARGNAELLKTADKRSPEWRAKQDFYAEALASLRAVKTAWRNPTMHVRGVYDEERTLDIFQAVRGLMRHLATELHE